MSPTTTDLGPELVTEGARYAVAWLQRVAADASSPSDFVALVMFLQTKPMLYGFACVILDALKSAHPEGARGAALIAPPLTDTRTAQADRAADFLELHPQGATLAEIDAAADLGSPTKVLSAMRRELGFGIAHGPDRWVMCARGGRRRCVRTYVLTHRPVKAEQLVFAF